MSETPAEIRDKANDLAMQSVLLHRLAVLRSGEWRELGFDSFDAWATAKNERHRIALSIPERRELVAELSAEGVPVVDQAAVLGVTDRTVKKVRRELFPPPERKPQVVDPAWGNASPEPTATSIAAREALEAERAALANHTERERVAGRWLSASDSVHRAAQAIAAALDADPRGEAARAGLTQRSPDVASTHLALLAARLDELGDLITKAQTNVTQAKPLRRVK